jgi:hypothetical protein
MDQRKQSEFEQIQFARNEESNKAKQNEGIHQQIGHQLVSITSIETLRLTNF